MKPIILVVLALALVACATPMQRDVGADIADSSKNAESLIEQARTPAPVYRQINSDASSWYGEAIVEKPREPAVLDAAAGYSHGPDGSLSEAITYLSRQVGVPMRITPDAVARAAEFTGDADGPGAFVFSAEGPLRSVLDLLAARTGTSWTWRDDHVLVYYLDTRIFDLDVLPSDVQDQTTITNATQTNGQQGGGGGGEGQGSSTSAVQVQQGTAQTTDVRYTMTFFGDAEKQIAVLLSKDGKVSVSPATGTITVRDNETVLQGVATYVENLNTRLKRQVVIELTMLTVTQSDSDALGINWDLVRQGVGDLYRINLNAFSDSPLDSTTMSATVVEPSSPWVGSQLLVDALRKQANATVTRRTIVNAMNAQPARVQDAAQDAFLINRQVAISGESGTALSGFVTRDEITGLSLNLLARILGDNTILLQVDGQVTAPLASKRVSADGTQLELPRKTLSNVFQRAHLSNGSTLVLTGLQQDDLSTDARGVGSPRFTLFGGGSRASRAQRYVVILLTPRIVS